MSSEERSSIVPAGTVTFLISDADEAVTAFPSATTALVTALEWQRATRGNRSAPRIALHTGEARLRDGYYTGAALHRGNRLRDVAHPGQTLLSAVTAALVTDELPAGSWLRDLGFRRLRDLSRPEQIFELRHADLTSDSPPPLSLDTVPHNLPIQLTSFVGRGDELAAVEELVTKERLVTLTGSGGCGKTRLAVQAAAELADRWPDGVWWVELGSVTDPSSIAELVASTVGVLVEPTGGPLRALTLQLRDRRLLVCLDNCEHLLEASAEMTETLLRSCPGISVLTTSREPLGVASETVWRVPSLNEDEAVSLFDERASRVRPWLTLDETNEAAVRSICRQLDGIPLAVELAAAWLRTLTPAQIAAGLDDRFALLVRGPRGVIARQQTLAASIDWSYDLLDETDRLVFRRLAVFAGGFTLDAARAVCAGGDVGTDAVLDAIGRLVDKSLVGVEERDGEARYRLLETIRQYASDRLDDASERPSAQARHFEFFLAFAEAAEAELTRTDQGRWLTRMETEHDNLRAALGWSLALDDPEPSRRLAAAMVWLWYLHGHAHEGLEFLHRAIALAPDDRSTLQARLYCAVAAVAIASGQFTVIVDYAQRAIEVAAANNDDLFRGQALFLLATVQSLIDFDASWRLFEEAERSAEAARDPFVLDGVFVLKGTILANRDQHDDARPLLQEGFERCLRRGDRSFAALALNYLDDAALMTGDVRRASELAGEALEIATPLSDYYAVGLATGHLAFAKGVAGDIEGGLRLMEKVVRSIEGADYGAYVPRMAPVLGKLCLWSGDFEGAVGWFERDVRLADPLAPTLVVARSLPGLAAALRHLGRLDEARARADQGCVAARAVGVPHVLADALEQSAMLAAPSDPDQAEDLHHQALAVRVEYGLRTFYVDSLDALAALAAQAGSSAEAARLIGASDEARADMGYPRRPIEQSDHELLVKTLRSALGDDEFEAVSRAGSALSLDEAVAYVRRARGSRGRPTTGWASLTPTELEVVHLVAEGLNNPEIGARLFISRGTVKTHLSHVFAKLSVTNRTELATMATGQLAKE